MGLKAPVRVIPRVFKNEHRYVGESARGALRPDRAACPHCGSGSLQPTGDRELRRCDGCGSSVSLDELASHHGEWLSETAAQRQAHFKSSARLLMQFAVVWLLLTVSWSAYAGSAEMLIVGIVITGLTFVGLFAMRYRAWQAATGRVFEAKAPLGDFVSDEVRSMRDRILRNSRGIDKAAYFAIRDKAHAEREARLPTSKNRSRDRDFDL